MISESRKNRISSVAKNRLEGVVILEDIHDPHNAAAVLRTCDAFGIQKVCFIFEKQEKFNPKKVGKASSSSANKWLDFEIFNSTKKCLAALKKRGYRVYATVLDGKAEPLGKIKFSDKKIALMFGNEHAGLSQTAIKLSDEHIYIPMKGFVQSLNLSVTAAVCLYEQSRQRQKSGKNFGLRPRQQNELIKIWMQK